MFKLLSFIFLIGYSNSLKTWKPQVSFQRRFATITDGVEFENLGREWRLKWSPDSDKKSLASVQQTLSLFKSAIAKVDGVKSVQRIVCGGCLDFKVIVSLPTDKFKAWESNNFAPEAEFIAAVKAIPGVTNIETQTYTIEPVI